MKPVVPAACVLLLLSACADAPPVQTATVHRPVAPLTIPPPPSGLPRPYEGAKIVPRTDDESVYARYLQTTPLFPDEAACDRNLAERVRSLAQAGSVKRSWVTRPYLAWGGVWKVGAVVGPVEYLFSITEAHVSYLDAQGKEVKSTYSCYAQYAREREEPAWRAGHVKHGSYLSEGHKKYASGPAQAFGMAPPGQAASWEPGIRYYRVDP